MKRVRMKKDKVLIIIFASLVILIVFLVVLLSDYNADTKAIYGERLDGIKEVSISNDKIREIEENIKSTDMVDSVQVYVQGKIIIAEVFVKNDISRDDSKSLGGKFLEKLSDDEKNFYDSQIFIDKKDDETFPIIGYRHHKKSDFSWTLDR